MLRGQARPPLFPYTTLFRSAAERNDVGALEAMLACGFDPNRPDAGIGKTALHSAAMEGWPDAVRVLLAHGASVHVRDREFKGQDRKSTRLNSSHRCISYAVF